MDENTEIELTLKHKNKQPTSEEKKVIKIT